MNTIRKGLEQLECVSSAEPDNINGTVSVEFASNAGEEEETILLAKLTEMGYPPAGQNTLGKKAKSYVSCMIGKVG